jgi:hypothetical protein
MRSVAAAADETPARTLGSRTRTATRSASDDGARRSFRKGADDVTGKTSGRVSKGGFNTYKKEVKTKDFGTFRVPADQVKVIAFLEEENFDLIYRHWVPGENGNVPRNCIADSDDDSSGCPLCKLGDEAKPVALFNVVDLDEPAKAQMWEAGPEIMRRVEKLYAELQEIPEAKGGPLSLNSPGVYAAVSREKAKSGRWEYTVKRVKARDLDEDFGLDPIDDDVLAGMKLFTIDDIKFNTVEELRELAATLSD